MCELLPKPIRTCPVAAHALECPESVAFVEGENKLSYHDCDLEIAACQALLLSQGINAGDRVVLIAPTSLENCIHLWALFRMGAVACPVNPALPPKNLKEIIESLYPCRMLGEIKTKVGSVSLHPAYSTIVMTSGSSGVPHAAVHSLENHVQAALAANRNMPLAPGDRWLLSLPLFHVAGLAILFRCALAGATIIVPESNVPFEDMLLQSGATHVSLVPTQLHRLLESSRAVDALRAMKSILLGGAPASPALIERAFDLGIPLICSYGMTETAAQLCATPPGASLETLLTSGYPLLPNALRIGSDDVIEVCGPTLFRGYVSGGDTYYLPLTDDGWFRTGDIGYLDDEGRLHVTGRADAMFISGGENIQPEEIEASLCTLPGVHRTVVVPVPYEEYGMVPAAFLDMAEQTAIDESSLRAELEKRLPRFKIPKHFFPWPNGLDVGMKVDRKALAKEAERMKY